MVFIIRLLLKIALKKWYREISRCPLIEYRQGKAFLVYKDTLNGSIPADRDGWVYLPFLAKYSIEFQPAQEEDTKVYVDAFRHGDILRIVNNKGEVIKKVKVEKDNISEIQIDGKPFIKGTVKEIEEN
ncbi:MAG: hypothetical protein IBX72_14985 [Nitrospirae bacterium]|jgi:hypothetical protein|nr:hypothetical protein [Nitrospirota bacterium]